MLIVLILTLFQTVILIFVSIDFIQSAILTLAQLCFFLTQHHFYIFKYAWFSRATNSKLIGWRAGALRAHSNALSFVFITFVVMELH